MKSSHTHQALGSLIGVSRVAAGIETQAELAARLGVSQQSVSRWEAGLGRPRDAQLRDLSGLLGIPFDTLDGLARAHKAPATSSPGEPRSYAAPFPVDRLDPETFERLVEWYLRHRYRNADVRRAGANGHDQGGEDVQVVFPNGERHAYQCKRTQSFGPRDMAIAVAAMTIEADLKVLVLSRTASPQTVDVARRQAGWELWDRETLSARIRDDLSEADQARLVDIFFRGQRQALLGIAEPGPWLTPEDYFAPFEGRGGALDLETPLQGREDALGRLHEWLAGDEPIGLLDGSAGVGKSRLLREFTRQIEIGAPTRRVWMLSLAEEPTRQSLLDLGAGPLLLVVDDAHNRRALTTIYEFVYAEGDRVRLLIATRPYALSSILADIGTYRLTRPPVIRLQLLDAATATALVRAARDARDLPEELAEAIAASSGGVPLVALMMARVVAETGMSLEMARGAEALRQQVVSRFARTVTALGTEADQRELRATLDVLALVQPFHVEDPQLISLIGRVTPIDPHDVPRLMKMLLAGGVIYERSREYRLMPDLLGDYLIEGSCLTATGRLAPFAERLLDDMPPALLPHALLNLGRMDWRLRDGDPSESRLLEGVWGRLRDIETAWDGRLEAVRDVAVYQPRQALDLVRHFMRARKFLEDLPPILRNISYVEAHFDETCALLWELGRDDGRPTSATLSHGVRVLADLAGYQVRKPLRISRQMLTFGLDLLDEPDAWTHAHTPLEFLTPLLSGQGMTTRSTRREVTFRSFFVSYDAVSDLRAKLIGAVLDRLPTASGRRGYRLGAFLADALRAPYGIANSDPGPELMDRYRAEFEATLRRIVEMVTTERLDDLTLVGIAKTVSGRRLHGREIDRELAEQIFSALPTDAAFHLHAALADGWGHTFTRSTDADSWSARTNAWLREVAAEVRAAWPDPEVRVESLEQAMGEVRIALGQEHSSYPLLGELVKGDLAFAHAFVRFAEQRRQSILRNYLSIPLAVWLAADRPAGRKVVERFLDSGELDLARSAAASLGDLEVTDAEDLRLLEKALAAPDPRVADWAVHSLLRWRDLAPRDLLNLQRLVRLPDAGIADNVAMQWTGLNQDAVLNVATEDDARQFLERIRDLPALEGHWLQTLISAFSVRFPHTLLDWIFDRVEAATSARSFDKQPIPYGPFLNHPLQFSSADDAVGVQARVWAWLQANSGRDDIYFREHAANVFEAIFSNGADRVVAFLETIIDTASSDELRQIGDVLRRAGQTFVFDHRPFVVRLLNRCRDLDPDLVEPITDRLWSSAVTGARGGTVGEPTPEDLLMREGAKSALAVLSRTSPAWPLYDHILRDAERNIARSLSELDDFD